MRSTLGFRSISKAILVLLFLSTTTGCAGLNYLFQAGKGQLALINHAKPIQEVIQDERTPPRVRRLLGEIPKIKQYGESGGLKPTRNYTEYVKLNRPAAVWVVSACEPLRFKSKEWSFPIAGRFPYLGWFDIEEGRKFAAKLKEEGWDVDLRGARAYSTLGWFRDAILSSMIADGEEVMGELVNVVLHESVHATFYINGQSYFDESIASFVADQMTIDYMNRHFGAQAGETKAYLKSEEESRRRAKQLHDAYDRLNQLYESSKSESDKLAEKIKILEALKTQLEFKREINNATLVQFKEYNVGMKEFAELLQACGGSWPRFWSAIKKVSERSFTKSQQDDLAPVILPLTASCR